ncbi:MAG: CIA30 family protein [Verrucomicrobiales bacterium]|nr:CIA30 family protein [Verrucomicrobiales bacterium]
MKAPLFALATILPTLAGLIFPILVSAEDAEKPWAWRGQTIAEFDEGDHKGPDWSITNDGVMGGLSKGKAAFSKEGIMTFSGTLSLENNGGFSLVETDDINRNLSNDLGLLLLVKGDGREYQIRLESEATYRGQPVSFSGKFQPKKGEWSQVKIPFADLKGGWRGRDLPDEKFNPAVVGRVGILLGDKKTGPFKVEVDWIRTYGKGQGEFTETTEKPADSPKANGPKSLIATAIDDGRFSTLKTALDTAKLTTFFQWDNKLTVFAPTNEAFAKLPEGTVENLLKPENKDRLVAILSHHVHAGSKGLAEALSDGTVSTIEKSPLSVRFQDGRIRVNDATLLQADIECSDGIIHVIDTVLIPKPERKTLLTTAQGAGTFKALLAAAKAAGLDAALDGKDDLTLFAPTDDAFAALPEGTVSSLLEKKNSKKLVELLTSHVVSGNVSAGDALNAGTAQSLSGNELKFEIKEGLFTVNGSVIRSAGIDGGNGTIHVVSSVIGFPETDCCEEDCEESCEENCPANEAAKTTQNTKSESCESCPSTAAAKVETINAADLIVGAIELGVPLYNSGNIVECAEVYEDCLIALSNSDRLDDRTREMLGRVTDAGKQKDPDTRAWFYRHALDRMMQLLSARS